MPVSPPAVVRPRRIEDEQGSFYLVPVKAESEITRPLTPREWEVASLVARGKVDKEIADELGIAHHTVRTHLKRIYDKLNVRSRAQMVAACAMYLRPPPRVASPPR